MILEIEEEENYKTREKQRQGGISTSLEQAQLALGQKRDAVSCTYVALVENYCVASLVCDYCSHMHGL